MSTSSTYPAIQLPEELHQDVQEWDGVQVEIFLKLNQGLFKLNDEHVQKLKEEDVDGSILLDLMVEELRSCGLTLGSAKKIVNAVRRLKGEEQATDSPVIINAEGDSVIYWDADAPKIGSRHTIKGQGIRTLRWIMRQFLKPLPFSWGILKNDVEKDNIMTKDSFNTDAIPSHAKVFVELLTAPKVRYSKPNSFITVLKAWLGNAFEKHLIAVTNTDNQRCSAVTPQDLVSYSRVVAQTEKWYQYDDDYTPLAKEINLAGLVVDDAIKALTNAYNRDKEHTNIRFKRSADAKEYWIWCPRSHFRVAIGRGGRGYALLVGETDSNGQLEEDALQPTTFGYQERAVEFFKRMHNFAAMAMQYKCNLPREDKTTQNALMAIRAPSGSTKQTGAASESMMMALSNLGFEVHHASHQPQDFQRSGITIFALSWLRRFHGTDGWTAPEVQEGAQWNPRAAEVWAVGKTFGPYQKGDYPG
ncbi:hypothetical protein FRC02_003805 [Tulasnella sp. 418]|nr:hypothetical protein FRC02_003805 [Tulasnella sp. 418]